MKFILKKNNTMEELSMNCRTCGAELGEGNKFCSACGSPVVVDIFCSNCGEKLSEETKFCPKCGTPAQGSFGQFDQSIPNTTASNIDNNNQKSSGNFKSNIVAKQISKLQNFITEQQADEISKIISTHALGAAAAGAAAGIPGAGATLSFVGQVGFIWSMYARISKVFNVEISKNKLKFLGSGILSNIATGAGSYLAASAVSLIPGIGTVASVALVSASNYALLNISGVLFLQLMGDLIKMGSNISDMSDDELKRRMDQIVKENNIKKMMKESQNEFTTAKKNGAINGDEKVDLEEM